MRAERRHLASRRERVALFDTRGALVDHKPCVAGIALAEDRLLGPKALELHDLDDVPQLTGIQVAK